MEKIELVKEFLKENTLVWDGMIYDKSKEVIREATEKDLNSLNFKTLMVKIQGLSGEQLIAIRVDINLTKFIIYGIDSDYIECYYIDERTQDLLENNLSKDWIKFCSKNNGLVYQKALEKSLKEKINKINKSTSKQIEKLNNKIEDLNKSRQEKIESLEDVRDITFNI